MFWKSKETHPNGREPEPSLGKKKKLEENEKKAVDWVEFVGTGGLAYDADQYAHLLYTSALFIEAANAGTAPQYGELLPTPPEETFVLVLYRGFLFVVFRSEASYDMCFRNAVGTKVATDSKETGGNHAHAGFWAIAKDFPLALVTTALRSRRDDVRGAFFVGHSVGGAVAQLVAARALQVLGAAGNAFKAYCSQPGAPELPAQAPLMGTITFGSPQSLGADMCRALGEVNRPLFHHVVLTGDPVPLATEICSRMAKKYVGSAAAATVKCATRYIAVAAAGVPVVGPLMAICTSSAFKHIGANLGAKLSEQRFFTYGVMVGLFADNVYRFMHDSSTYASYREQSMKTVQEAVKLDLHAAASIEPYHGIVNYRTSLLRCRWAPWSTELLTAAVGEKPAATPRTPLELQQLLYPFTLAGISIAANAELPKLSVTVRLPSCVVPDGFIKILALLSPTKDPTGADVFEHQLLTITSSGEPSARQGTTLTGEVEIPKEERDDRCAFEGVRGVLLQTVFGSRFIVHTVVFRVLKEYVTERPNAPPLCADSPLQCPHNTDTSDEAEHSDEHRRHMENASHVCRAGKACPMLTSKEHGRLFVHVPKLPCPHINALIPRCPYITSAEHRMEYSHGQDPRGVWDFIAQCPLGMACPQRSDPQHCLNMHHSDLCAPYERDKPYFDECPLAYIVLVDSSSYTHEFEKEEVSNGNTCGYCNRAITGKSAKAGVCKHCKLMVHKKCISSATRTKNCPRYFVPQANTANLALKIGSSAAWAATTATGSALQSTSTTAHQPLPFTTPKATTPAATAAAAKTEAKAATDVVELADFVMGSGPDVMVFGQQGKAGWGTLAKHLPVFAVQFVKTSATSSASDDEEKQKALAVVLDGPLRHPCVLQFVGCATDTSSFSLVFERTPEGVLSDMLFAPTPSAPLGLAQATNIVRCLCLALQHIGRAASASEAVREAVCDDGDLVRPDVVFVCNWGTGHVKLGCVTKKEQVVMTYRCGQPGAAMVLPYAYHAPEHFEPKGADSKSTSSERPQDVYSLGLVVWELVERQPAFAALRMCEPELVEKVKKGERPLFQNAEHPLKPVAEKCWQKDPSARPTCAELLDELAALGKQA